MEIQVVQKFKLKCANCSFRRIDIASRDEAVEIAEEHLKDYFDGARWHELKLSEVTILKEADEDE